jgi:hypothetical protein
MPLSRALFIISAVVEQGIYAILDLFQFLCPVFLHVPVAHQLGAQANGSRFQCGIDVMVAVVTLCGQTVDGCDRIIAVVSLGS